MDNYVPSRRDKFLAWVLFALMVGAMVLDTVCR